MPNSWSHYAYPSLKPLASWIKDFHKRIEMIQRWSEDGQPKSFWLPGFFFPQGFLTGVLQNHSRKTNIPIDTLQFNFKVKDIYEGDQKIENNVDNEEGVLIHGLHMEGARWDAEKRLIQDSFAMNMYSVII